MTRSAPAAIWLTATRVPRLVRPMGTMFSVSQALWLTTLTRWQTAGLQISANSDSVF
jgi:hypothetical protein